MPTSEYIIDRSIIDTYLSQNEEDALKFEILRFFLVSHNKKALVLKKTITDVNQISHPILKARILSIISPQDYFSEDIRQDERQLLLVLCKNCSPFFDEVIFVTNKYHLTLDETFSSEAGKKVFIYTLQEFINGCGKDFREYIDTYFFQKRYKELLDTLFFSFRV